MLSISLNDLKLECIIGVYPHEREHTQTLILNLTVELSSNKACESDQLDDAVDYERLESALLSIAHTSQYQLIEKLAQVLVNTCFEFDSRVRKVELQLEKPECLKHTRSASVVIRQKRHTLDPGSSPG